MSKDVDKALAEFRAAIWRERWVFIALCVSVMLVLASIVARAALGEPRRSG